MKLTENCKYEQNSFQLSRSIESYFLKSECNCNDIVLITVLRLVIINRDLFHIEVVTLLPHQSIISPVQGEFVFVIDFIHCINKAI